MKNRALVLVTFFILISLCAYSQDVTGSWKGKLLVRSTELNISFNITQEAGQYSATMDSPDQGAFGIPMTKIIVNENEVRIMHTAAQIDFIGIIQKPGFMKGTFNQAGILYPLELTRDINAKQVNRRPQEPKPPFPYISEDVKIFNKADSITLAGTLTLPEKPGVFPVVVLISGSGPQDRNEELFGHKPFLVLSDYLTRNGVAVLRFDDRGTAESEGTYAKSTIHDFVRDVKAVVEYLKTRKDIDKSRIGLIGHSEGGVIAPIVASEDKEIGFIVLMAGTGVSGDELLIDQLLAIGIKSGFKEEDMKQAAAFNKGAFDIIKKLDDNSLIREQLRAYILDNTKNYPAAMKPQHVSDTAFADMLLGQFASPWICSFVKYNPATALKRVTCPVLAINGSNDLQVTPKLNLQAIESALKEGGNKSYTIKELSGLNHLFQESETGVMMEYGLIEQTISPVALEEIGNWIKLQIAKK